MSRKMLIINEEDCWGCLACQVACKQEKRTPSGINLIKIQSDGPRKVNNKLNLTYRIKVCIHCDDPPCAEACPESAIIKRDDAIVIIDKDLCTGCGTCIEACPFDAISLDMENNRAIKCDMCYHRIDAGLLPACADSICLGHCINLITEEK